MLVSECPLQAFVSQFVPLVGVLNTVLIQLKANCKIPAGSVLNITGDCSSDLVIILLRSLHQGYIKLGVKIQTVWKYCQIHIHWLTLVLVEFLFKIQEFYKQQLNLI